MATQSSDPLVTAPVDEVAGLVRGLFATVADPAALAAASDDELLAAVADAETLGRVIDGVRALAAGEVAERSRRLLGHDSLAVKRGCRSAGELLERVTGVAGATARDRMRTAERLRPGTTLTGGLLPAAFPVVREAVADGTLGTDAAAAITTVLGPAREHGADPAAVAVAEQELVDAAIGVGTTAVSADEVRIMAQAWALFLDPDGALPDEQKGMRRRGLTLGRRREGTVPCRGELLPEVAAQLQRLIDAYENPRVRHSEEHGSGPRFREDTAEDGADVRSAAQRRHDALAGILAVAASHAEAPALGGAAPTLVVAVTPDQLDAADGVAFLQGVGAAEAPVPASVARHSGCAGQLQKVVLDPEGRIVELGAPQRVFTAHQRRAITLRDGECIIPGCHVPATWCEVHHVVDHAKGGPTHTGNGVLLCWWHHRTIDTSGWEIRFRDGIPWIRPPGWVDPARAWHPAPQSPLQAWRRRRAKRRAPRAARAPAFTP